MFEGRHDINTKTRYGGIAPAFQPIYFSGIDLGFLNSIAFEPDDQFPSPFQRYATQ